MYFNVCKATIYSEFRTQVHRDRDGRERIPFAFIILQKHVLLLWGHTNKRRVFTDLKDVLLLSVWPEIEYFKSKWGAVSFCSASTQTLEQRTFL